MLSEPAFIKSPTSLRALCPEASFHQLRKKCRRVSHLMLTVHAIAGAMHTCLRCHGMIRCCSRCGYAQRVAEASCDYAIQACRVFGLTQTAVESSRKRLRLGEARHLFDLHEGRRGVGGIVPEGNSRKPALAQNSHFWLRWLV